MSYYTLWLYACHWPHTNTEIMVMRNNCDKLIYTFLLYTLFILFFIKSFLLLKSLDNFTVLCCHKKCTYKERANIRKRLILKIIQLFSLSLDCKQSVASLRLKVDQNQIRVAHNDKIMTLVAETLEGVMWLITDLSVCH